MNRNADGIEISERGGGVEFPLKVVPGSSRNKVAGVWDTALRVAVAAPPEGGRANTEVIRLLANTLGVRRADVSITHGQTQPLKRVRISGLTAARARQLLENALTGSQ